MRSLVQLTTHARSRKPRLLLRAHIKFRSTLQSGTIGEMNIKVLVVVIALATAALAVDLTVVENAVGADVVLATITKIENAEISPSDKRILRRIAYVETADGVTPPPDGGIWNVKSENFAMTQEDMRLSFVLMEINIAFQAELLLSGVGQWEDLEWEDLDRPLWSALAARLWIYLQQEEHLVPIPTSSDIIGQASFWNTYYNTDGDPDKFIDDVEQLELDESEF